MNRHIASCGLLLTLSFPIIGVAQSPSADTPAAEAGATPVAEKTTPDDTGDSYADETVTIIGDPLDAARIGGAAQVIDEAKLEEKDYDDIHRVLRQVPGVYVREEDGFGLRPNIGIRGASSDRSAKVTLMEDGILFSPAPYSAPAAYFFPLTTRMVAVEVVKGPASVQYGPHTVGGAINLVTRPIPEKLEAAGDVSLGQYQTTKVHGWAGNRWGRFGLLLEGVRLQTDGFKDLDGGGDTGFDRNEFMLKSDYRWRLGGIDMTSAAKIGYSDELSNETYLGLSDGDFDKDAYRRYAASQRDKMNWDRWQFQFSNSAVVNPDLSFNLTGYRHNFSRTWRKLNSFENGAPTLRDIFANPTGINAVFLSVLRGDSDSTSPLETLLVGKNARDFVSQGSQFAGNWYVPTGPLHNNIEGGIRLHFDSIVRNHTEDPYVMQNARMVRGSGPRRTIVDNQGEALALATYLRDEVIWGPLTLTPGLRVESIWTYYKDRLPTHRGQPSDSNNSSEAVVIPGIGSVYSLTDEISMLAGVHRGFSPVAPGQSDSVDPEESVNYEGGLRYAGAYVSGVAIGFYNDYSNLLATCRQGTGCDPNQVDEQFNAGGVDVYGLEFLADTEPELGWQITAPLSLTYTFTQSEFRSTFSSASAVLGDVEKGDALPYVPEHVMSLSVGLRRGQFGTTATLTYVGEMRDVAGKGHIPGNERIDSHFVGDLMTFWDFSENGRVYLGVDNFADDSYMVSRRPFGARPGKPLLVQGGIKYHFGG